MPRCNQCQTEFSITPQEREIMDKVAPVINGVRYDFPDPEMCADCDHRHRCMFRNESYLHKRKCDKTGKDFVTIYHPDSKVTVYDSDVWWGDDWDSCDFGREYDFSRPFFEQFAELMRVAPLPSSTVFNSVNSDYNAFVIDSKDVYMSRRIGSSERVYYSYLAIKCYDCVDCYSVYDCNRCYECTDCYGCYECRYTVRCQNSKNLNFCYDCIGCENCFGCVGLRHQKNYLFNRQVMPEEYRDFLDKFRLGKKANVKKLKDKFYSEVVLQTPLRAQVIEKCENVSGDYIKDSRNVSYSFDVEGCEDVLNSWGTEYCKDSVRGDFLFYAEKSYNQLSIARSTDVACSYSTTGCSNIYYCYLTVNNCSDCFGCVGLKKKSYCILNKQYTKEEYFELLPRIIEHMRQSGEWGRYFPATLAPFPYNQTVAQEYFPIDERSASEHGLWWSEEKYDQVGGDDQVADDIRDVSDEVLDRPAVSTLSGKPFKILKQELEFYRSMDVPIPLVAPTERHLERVKARNPRRLWKRECAKCGKEVESSYGPERKERVYCGECYEKEVY